jgi:hypothetical protein
MSKIGRLSITNCTCGYDKANCPDHSRLSPQGFEQRQTMRNHDWDAKIARVLELDKGGGSHGE